MDFMGDEIRIADKISFLAKSLSDVRKYIKISYVFSSLEYI